MDEGEEVETSGPGSENRTRFFGLLGVLVSPRVVCWDSSSFVDCETVVLRGESA